MPRMTHDRRSYLSLASQASGLVLLGAWPARGHEASWRAPSTPFTLGVPTDQFDGNSARFPQRAKGGAEIGR